MGKFADLHTFLQTQPSVLETATWHTPEEAPAHAWVEAVHAPAYYHSFISGSLSDAEARRIGFGAEMRRPELIRRTLLECSGTVLTARLALQHGIACNLAGGTHHAHHDFGSGFTILNDLAVAAKYMISHERLERVAIVDLDVHQGDGTASIFEGDMSVFTLSMHCGDNFPLRKSRSDLDIDVPAGTADADYLRMLSGALPAMLASFRCLSLVSFYYWSKSLKCMCMTPGSNHCSRRSRAGSRASCM